MLRLPDNTVFASGVMNYGFHSITSDGMNQRILIHVFVDDLPIMAAVDTGAPYLILAPEAHKQFDLDPFDSLAETTVKIRGTTVWGNLYRMNVLLPAAEGEECLFEATAFVPATHEEEKWGDLPSFLGIEYCLERIRFAFDPAEDMFYFGALP